MDTQFSPAVRTPAEEWTVALHEVTRDPVVSSLLESVGGMLAVLDRNRQVLTVNRELLESLGLDTEDCLGLRPGEVLGCLHAQESPAGCGSTPWCASCGAAIAIATAQGSHQPCEKNCVLERPGKPDLFLRVRCAPLERKGLPLLTLFLRDISREQRLDALEKAFFHDVRGLVTGIVGYTDLLVDGADRRTRRSLESLQGAALRLAREVDLQGRLVRDEPLHLPPRQDPVRAEDLLQELCLPLGDGPSRDGIGIELGGNLPSRLLQIDGTLVLRVLRNMLTNALEASVPGDTVEVSYCETESEAIFMVANPAVIPASDQLRIFQRNFSTKLGAGRGLGTWSMRFFGEEILGGKVDFSSRPGEGTVFTLRLQA